MSTARADTHALHLGGPGDVPRSRSEAEVRVLRALATERQPGIVRGVSLGYGQGWPSYTHEADEVAAAAEQRRLELGIVEIDSFIPTKRDRSDWDTALQWFGALNAPPRAGKAVPTYSRTQRIIRWRSFGLDREPPSWAWIATQENQTRQAVAQHYDRGIDDIWRASRGLLVRRRKEVAR